MTPTVLVVEDEPEIRAAVRAVVEALGVAVIEAANGRDAIEAATVQRPQLVLLDLGLPDVPGDEVCRAIRAMSSAPIVVVSARHSEREKVRLLDIGADDYLTKPFGPAELGARVRAQLRRVDRRDATPAPARGLRLGDVVLDLVDRAASRGGESVRLTPIEWGILRALARVPGRTVTHEQLFEAVWDRDGDDGDTAAPYLRVHMTNLRRKIEREPSRPVFLVTEPGVGYRLELPA